MFSLVLRDVNKIYKTSTHKVIALDNVNLKIPSDIIITICGSSGSGKTTLLNIIGGIDKPSSGDIYLNGNNYSSLPNKSLSDFRFKNIGYIFQDNYLIQDLNVFDNIMLGMTIGPKKLQLSQAIIKEKVNKIIKLVGLTDWIDHKIYELSGGQAQRVAIARAVVKDPMLILADEPTANLDIENSHIVLELLNEIREKYKCTCLISTHDSFLVNNTENVIKIKEGKIGECKWIY